MWNWCLCMNEALIIIIILMVLQLHLWLFYFPHHSLIVLGESRLTAILPFLRFPRKEESCSGEIIVLKVLYLSFFYPLTKHLPQLTCDSLRGNGRIQQWVIEGNALLLLPISDKLTEQTKYLLVTFNFNFIITINWAGAAAIIALLQIQVDRWLIEKLKFTFSWF